MTIQCKKCGHKMTTFVESVKLVKNVGKDLKDLLKEFLLPDPLRRQLADDLNSYNEECPNCRNRGQWKDID